MDYTEQTEQAIQFQSDTDRYQQTESGEVAYPDINLFSIVMLLFCISLILSLCLYYGYTVYSQLIGVNDVNIIYDVLGS